MENTSKEEMNTPKHQFIDDVLQSIETLQDVEVNPFLYTRIQARLQPNGIDKIKKSWVWATALTLLFLVAVNLLTWTSGSRRSYASGTNAMVHEYFQEQFNSPY